MTLVDHAHRGDHRVEREHDVEHGDLDEDAAVARQAAACRGGLLIAFERAVDLVDAFPEQEQAAADQDQVAPRDRLAET